MKSRNRRRAGFTLVEMMVVIVIIGILATIIIVNIGGKADQAKQSTTKALLKTVSQQVEMFKLNHEKYPESLMDLYEMPSYVDSSKWKPYLTDAPLDGWGREFIYRVPGSDGYPFDIVSLGADGKEGGTSYDEDLWNHRRK